MHLFNCSVCQTVNMNTLRLGKWENYLYSGGCENEICWELARAVWSVRHQWASTNGNSTETKQYLSPVYPTAPDWHYLAAGRLSLSSLNSSLAFCNPFFSHFCCLVSKFTRCVSKVSRVSHSFFFIFKHKERHVVITVWFLVANSDVMCVGLLCFFAVVQTQPVGSENINEAGPQLRNVPVKWSMSHTGLTLEKELIDRWSDGLMTDSIPPETGWQKDISGKLCTNRHSSQRAPSCQLASGWWGKWLMTAVSLPSAPPRHPRRLQLLPRQESISLSWQVWQSKATSNLGLIHPINNSCPVFPFKAPVPENQAPREWCGYILIEVWSVFWDKCDIWTFRDASTASRL